MNAPFPPRLESRLAGVSETSLITLWARAHEEALFSDPWALRCLTRLEHDWSKFADAPLTAAGVAIRARAIDDVVRAELARRPRPVVSLGCGLDARRWRVDAAVEAASQVRACTWVDLDLPPVAALNKVLLPTAPGRHLVAASLLDSSWCSEIPRHTPPLILCEGVLMYLQPRAVERLFEILRAHFPGAMFVADVLSPLAARSAPLHATVARTGSSFGWGVTRGRTVARRLGARLRRETSLYTLFPQRWGRWGRIASVLPFVSDSWRLLELELRG
jgi:O-methyltransferase involved in polyketide biosynthesis